MSVSAAEVRKFAVAACSYGARAPGPGKDDFERRRAALYTAFKSDGVALDLLGEISRAAQVVTDSRRYSQNNPLDSRAEADFEIATNRLVTLTNRLIRHVEQQH